jgi:hypothetical protein
VLRFGYSLQDGSAWQVSGLSRNIPDSREALGQLSVSGLTSVGVDTYRPNRWISNVFDPNDT